MRIPHPRVRRSMVACRTELARGLDHARHWTTDAALARESETIALMRAGQGAEKTVMRRWMAETKLHRGCFNEGQKEAVKTILASKDRVLGIQGYAGTGRTTMLKRLRADDDAACACTARPGPRCPR